MIFVDNILKKTQDLFFGHSEMVSSTAIWLLQFNISELLGHSLFYLTHNYRTLSGATTPGPSRLRGNGNQRVIYISQISMAGASLLDCLMSYPGYSLEGGVWPLCSDAISVFYRLGQLSFVNFFIIIVEEREKEERFGLV